ncbi:MAG: HesA/MoeB/ThiF family protein [Candidatus Fermentithermobacillus carboniphilus]|uniref:HesA/MoeB/ThiF family protein n=1 Tax=Candidatus Fermentithermobacillus carboniphilus TaxID=3085328 RepID=A0AAT9LD69_9FIRM|nr:MAG: HesA/MoeB/ThiF family protein [Candidatus Fermentithermobacillus carboniphilus]
MLSPEEKERYARQILVPEIGEVGQEILSAKRVLVVGAGGLGTPCTSYLAGAGVGHIGLLDSDEVSLSNLPRQIMYDMNDLGKRKADVLSRKLSAANPLIRIEPITEKLTEENVHSIVRGFDVVASCVDNLETRYILNEACVRAGIPMVEGAVYGFTGLVTVILPGRGPCYECIFPKRPQLEKKPVGVAGPSPGVIGSIQAAETLKLLLGKGQPLAGRLVLIDLLTASFQTIVVAKNPECRVCRNMGR